MSNDTTRWYTIHVNGGVFVVGLSELPNSIKPYDQIHEWQYGKNPLVGLTPDRHSIDFGEDLGRLAVVVYPD